MRNDSDVPDIQGRSIEQASFFRGSSKPYVRWWWLAGPITRTDISRQLQWVQENGFGGVELAWIHPSWLEESYENAPRPAWLSAEWSELVAFTKQQAEALALGCDFTFGSSWPFGGSWVGQEQAAQTFTGWSEQRLGGSWENRSDVNQQLFIVNHLSRKALECYAAPLVAALRKSLESGSPSALFCDSLEIATERLWSAELWREFHERFGYDLQPFAENLDEEPAIRYDYRQFRGEVIRREFYEAFTKICHENGSYARVQCHGAPTDLLAAYAAVDIPESEALLFRPEFSRIAASAAAWNGKPVVSAETFTCLYGFSGWDDSADEYWNQETIGDLKLLADSLFVQGVNQIVWHGMPFQPGGDPEVQFYAATHVGPDSAFIAHLPGFNEYLREVSGFLREGTAYDEGVGVYLPWEDALMQDRLPLEERLPGANFRWEMRHATLPTELAPFHPFWISYPFLREAQVIDGKIRSRHLTVRALFVDCEWLDRESLRELRRLSEAGAVLIWKRRTRQPGWRVCAQYEEEQEAILQAPTTCSAATFMPLLEGEDLPPYWARLAEDQLLLFFAHPRTKQIRYPMPYQLSQGATAMEQSVRLRWRGCNIVLSLCFADNMPVALSVSEDGQVTPRIFSFEAVAQQ